MTLPFRPGKVAGVLARPLEFHQDDRGWLCEIFRHDEIPEKHYPVMGYVSATNPGVVRGPHEHRLQSDCFGFFDPVPFRLYLWDNRPDSESYQVYEELEVGGNAPTLIIIPAGVVHAYKNIGDRPALVINCPNQLYKGQAKSQPSDEIRHEDRPGNPFQVP